MTLFGKTYYMTINPEDDEVLTALLLYYEYINNLLLLLLPPNSPNPCHVSPDILARSSSWKVNSGSLER